MGPALSQLGTAHRCPLKGFVPNKKCQVLELDPGKGLDNVHSAQPRPCYTVQSRTVPQHTAVVFDISQDVKHPLHVPGTGCGSSSHKNASN
jgi:hypothetical protein